MPLYLSSGLDKLVLGMTLDPRYGTTQIFQPNASSTFEQGECVPIGLSSDKNGMLAAETVELNGLAIQPQQFGTENNVRRR